MVTQVSVSPQNIAVLISDLNFKQSFDRQSQKLEFIILSRDSFMEDNSSLCHS